MNKRQEYIEKCEAKLKKWNAEIRKLEAMAEEAKIEKKADYYEKIDELRRKKNEAHEKLERIKKASDDAWQEMRTGVVKSWDRLSESFENALKNFKT